MKTKKSARSEPIPEATGPPSKATTRQDAIAVKAGLLASALWVAVLSGCGGADVEFGGGSGSDAEVIVAGNLDSVSPVTSRDIVLFVYEIDAGDPIAILDDVDCDLNDVSGGKTITLEDIDIHFSATPESECEDGVDDPPAAGRARAKSISLSLTDEIGS